MIRIPATIFPIIGWIRLLKLTNHVAQVVSQWATAVAAIILATGTDTSNRSCEIVIPFFPLYIIEFDAEGDSLIALVANSNLGDEGIVSVNRRRYTDGSNRHPNSSLGIQERRGNRDNCENNELAHRYYLLLFFPGSSPVYSSFS